MWIFIWFPRPWLCPTEPARPPWLPRLALALAHGASETAWPWLWPTLALARGASLALALAHGASEAALASRLALALAHGASETAWPWLWPTLALVHGASETALAPPPGLGSGPRIHRLAPALAHGASETDWPCGPRSHPGPAPASSRARGLVPAPPRLIPAPPPPRPSLV